MENKQLPQSDKSEIVVLSSLLTATTEDCDDIFSTAKPEFFFHRSHKFIFETIYNQYSDGKPFDFITILEILKTKGTLENAGGEYFLTQLMTSHYPRYDVINCIELLKVNFQLRSMIELSEEISIQAHSGYEPKDIISNAEDKIFDLGTKMQIQTENLVSKAVIEVKDMIKIRRSGEKIFGLQSGIKSFDDTFGGFLPAQYYVIGARPSTGKSAFADQIVNYLVTRNKPVLYICLEAGATRVLSKMACKLARISYTAFSRGFCTDKELDAVEQATVILQSSPLIIKRPYRITGADIRSLVKRESRKHDIQLMVLDYLQNVDQGKDDERIAIVKASRAIQDVTVETGVPSLILAQINREGGNGSRPTMSELKGSGQIEQDADNIGLLWPQEDPFKVEMHLPLPVVLSVEKNKDGARGIDLELNFNRSLMTFNER